MAVKSHARKPCGGAGRGSPAPERRCGRGRARVQCPEEPRETRAGEGSPRPRPRRSRATALRSRTPCGSCCSLLPPITIPKGLSAGGETRLSSRGSGLSSFKLKLVAYFVLLSLVPLAATYWGFSTVADAGQSREVTLRQEAGLRAALALYGEQADRAQERAEQLARSRPLQRALERRDRRALRRIVADRPALYVIGTGGLHIGTVPRLVARFPVDVVTGAHRLGEVVATIPLDVGFVAHLRQR